MFFCCCTSVLVSCSSYFGLWQILLFIRARGRGAISSWKVYLLLWQTKFDYTVLYLIINSFMWEFFSLERVNLIMICHSKHLYLFYLFENIEIFVLLIFWWNTLVAAYHTVWSLRISRYLNVTYKKLHHGKTGFTMLNAFTFRFSNIMVCDKQLTTYNYIAEHLI